MKTIRFDHEKLNVYHRSLKFITWTTDILQRVPSKLSVHGQLDRASTSKITSKIKNTAAPLLIFLLILICPAMPAQDWPRWGGNDPGRNMYSPAKGLPDRFDPGKPKSGTEDSRAISPAMRLTSASKSFSLVASTAKSRPRCVAKPQRPK